MPPSLLASQLATLEPPQPTKTRSRSTSSATRPRCWATRSRGWGRAHEARPAACAAAAARATPISKNVHGHTVDRLGEAIVAGRYAVGGAVPPEPLLCDELGVSRTVVREAVKSLVAKGLLVTGPKVGTRVLPADSGTGSIPT